LSPRPTSLGEAVDMLADVGQIGEGREIEADRMSAEAGAKGPQ